MSVRTKWTVAALFLTFILLMVSFSIIVVDGGPTRSPPSAPTKFQVESDDKKVKLTWEDPQDDGGSERTGFNVYRGSTIDTLNPLDLTIGPFVYSFTDTGVVNGVFYFYAVRAVNLDDGAGVFTDPIQVKPVGPASKPNNVTGSYRSEEVILSWKAPDLDGGNTIEGYSIYKGRSTGNYDTTIDLGFVFTYSDFDVSNGSPYYYRIFAMNGFKNGTKSQEVVVTPSGPPGPPSDFSAISNNRRVQVNWSYPLNDGGGILSGYNVYRGSSRNSLEFLHSLSAVKNGYMDGDIVAGETYYYAVSAINSEGEGDMTDPIGVIPTGVPDTPLNATSRPGDTKAYLFWKTPEEDGGKEILGYRIYKTTLGSTMKLLVDVGLQLEYVDSNLTNGETYYYQIRSYNEIGESNPTQSMDIKPEDSPAPPQNFRVKAFEGYLQCIWSLPSFFGDNPITEFHLFKGASEIDMEILVTMTKNDSMYIDEDVEIGVEYFYSIRSHSLIGNGPFSPVVPAMAYTIPDIPESPEGLMGDGFVLLQWEAPVFNGGREITNYKVYRGEAADKMAVIETLDGETLEYLDENVVNGRTYLYSIQAINEEMEGDLTEPIGVTPVGPPGVPTNFIATTQKESIFFQWGVPSSDGGSEITGYIIMRGEHQLSMEVYLDVGLVLNYTDNEAVVGESYFYSVKAVNGEGVSKESTKTLVEVTKIEKDEDTKSSPIFIVAIAVIVLLLIGAVIAGIILSRKKNSEEDEEDIKDNFEESEKEKEHRLLMERRKQMSEFTDVALSSEEAHMTDHEEHNLTYDDLYGTKDQEEKPAVETPPQQEVSDPQPQYQPPPEQPQPDPVPAEYQPPPAPEPVEEAPPEQETEYIPPQQ